MSARGGAAPEGAASPGAPSGAPPSPPAAADASRSRLCPSPDSVVHAPSPGGLSSVKRRLDLGDARGDPLDDLAGSDDSVLEVFEDAEEDFDEPRRRVTFADQFGSPLQQVRIIDSSETKRMILLLLNPVDRIYEFIHAEYPMDRSTTVGVMLEQIPATLAANPSFHGETFSALAKTGTVALNHVVGMPAPVLLPPDHALEECCLQEGELVLGVLEGYALEDIAGLAIQLLLNRRIMKAVVNAKRAGRALKTVERGSLWRAPNHDSATLADSSSSPPCPAAHHEETAHLSCSCDDGWDQDAMLLSLAERRAEATEAVPWKYPERVRDRLGGEQGAEKLLLWIHAMSIVAVAGYSVAAS